MITEHGTHAHGPSSAADRGFVFTPLQDRDARAYLASGQRLCAHGLEAFLLARGHVLAALPSAARRSRWLKNRKPPPARVEPPAPRVACMVQNLSDWPTAETPELTGLFRIATTDCNVVDESAVCAPFSCQGMVNTLRRWSDSTVVMTVDTKQNCLAHGYGVLTMSMLHKYKLRRTTLARHGGKKVQGDMFTSHASPVLQAVIHVESTENIVRAFQAVCQLWQRAAPQRRPLPECLSQIHKDFLPAIEAARRSVFPHTRPVDDFFHFMEKKATIEKKLKHLDVAGKKDTHFEKQHYGWCIATLDFVRHLPTVDIFSMVYEGFLAELTRLDEPLLVEYLGPAGMYARRATARALRDDFHVHVNTDNLDSMLLFSSWWQGILGIVPGTACGDQPQEAFHVDWKRQLDVLGKNAPPAEALPLMQTLYTSCWQSQHDWSSRTPLTLQPAGPNPHLCTGSCCTMQTATPHTTIGTRTRKGWTRTSW